MKRGTPRPRLSALPAALALARSVPDHLLHRSLRGWTAGLFLVVLKDGLSATRVQTQQVSLHRHLGKLFLFRWGSARGPLLREAFSDHRVLRRPTLVT